MANKKHGSRPPHVDLATLLSKPNPTIDLKLDDYNAKATAFIAAVGSYTSRATNEITQRRQAHAAEKKRVADRAQAIESETSQCKLTELELLATLEREREETKQAESSVQNLRREHASVKDAIANADAEIAHYRALVESLRRGTPICSPGVVS